METLDLNEIEEILDAIAAAIQNRARYTDLRRRIVVVREVARTVREDLERVEAGLAWLEAEGE